MTRDEFLASPASRFMLSSAPWPLRAKDQRNLLVGDVVRAKLWSQRRHGLVTVEGEVLGFGEYEGSVFFDLHTDWEIAGVRSDPGKLVKAGSVCEISFHVTGAQYGDGGVYVKSLYQHHDDSLRQDTEVASFEIIARPGQADGEASGGASAKVVGFRADELTFRVVETPSCGLRVFAFDGVTPDPGGSFQVAPQDWVDVGSFDEAGRFVGVPGFELPPLLVRELQRRAPVQAGLALELMRVAQPLGGIEIQWAHEWVEQMVEVALNTRPGSCRLLALAVERACGVQQGAQGVVAGAGDRDLPGLVGAGWSQCDVHGLRHLMAFSADLLEVFEAYTGHLPAYAYANGTLSVSADEWEEAAEAWGLDTSFCHTAQQMADAVNAYHLLMAFEGQTQSLHRTARVIDSPLPR